MGFKFSQKSLEKLLTCDERVQTVMNEAIKKSKYDFAVIEGHRGKELQDLYYAEGKSKLKWPNSRHNKYPSVAVDIVPYIKKKANWEEKYFQSIAKTVLEVAEKLGIKIQWGGHWTNFIDMPHFQLEENE